jgi:hypothetical protein
VDSRYGLRVERLLGREQPSPELTEFAKRKTKVRLDPAAMAGIRTAAVWTIGAATLATPVGQTSLGNYIFSGLQTENWVFVLFGCVAAPSRQVTWMPTSIMLGRCGQT